MREIAARRTGPLIQVALLSLTGVLLGGCAVAADRDAAGAGSETSPSSSPPTATATVTASPSEAPDASPTGTTPAPPPLCGTPDLGAEVHADAGGGTAGSTHSQVWLVNDGDHPCRTAGWPGVSYVGDGDGSQVGAAADRTGEPGTVTLIPGAHAVAELTEADPGALGPCGAQDVDGLRIYPPDNRGSLFVDRPGSACSDSSAHQLEIAPVHPAS